MMVREAYIAYRETAREFTRQTVVSAEDVVELMRPVLLERAEQEQLWVLLLDSKLGLLGRTCLFIGTLDAVVAHPREILRLAVLSAAHSFIIVHNHPSGDPDPSRQDESISEQLADAGKLLGINLCDHLIIGTRTKTDGFWSWATGR